VANTESLSPEVQDKMKNIARGFFDPWAIVPTNEEPVRIEGDIPIALPIVDGRRFLFISKDQRALTHGIHKYPAKFFPELPRWIVQRYSKRGDRVLDPFMGSGTVNLEASLLGRRSIGIDVDPFSKFLARVKTTPLLEHELLSAWRSIRKRVDRYIEPAHFDGVPEFPYRDNWFKPHALKELAHIKTEIEKTAASQEIKDFFLVCFSSVIRQVSEADNNCTRTVIRKTLGKQVPPGMAINLFLKRAETQVENMRALSALDPSGDVFIPDDVDARDMGVVSTASIDLAVTSPPYANAVDYPRTHQLEIYWLGFADGSLQSLKAQHVGTEVVKSKDYSELHTTGCEEADKVIEQIYRVDPRRAYIAAKYLLDMFANLEEVYRVLKKKGYYVLVVGNNLMRGFEFETWKYLYDQAPRTGFKVETYFISEIINHFIKVPRKERINDDYILVLRK
jgi:DNA modification methylase